MATGVWNNGTEIINSCGVWEQGIYRIENRSYSNIPEVHIKILLWEVRQHCYSVLQVYLISVTFLIEPHFLPLNDVRHFFVALLHTPWVDLQATKFKVYIPKWSGTTILHNYVEYLNYFQGVSSYIWSLSYQKIY